MKMVEKIILRYLENIYNMMVLAIYSVYASEILE